MDELVRSVDSQYEEQCRYFERKPSGEKFPWAFYGSKKSVAADGPVKIVWMAMPHSEDSENYGPCRSVLYTNMTCEIVKEREFQFLIKKRNQ